MLNTIISGSITLSSLLICLAAAMALGVLNALVFSFKNRYTSSFTATIALMPLIVTMIIMIVNGNIGAGIAVAGAFTLVRFRSAAGSAREIAAIFTSMALGLVLGMGYIGVAAIFFVCVAVFVLVLTAVDFGGERKNELRIRITIPENYDYNNLFDDIFVKYGVDAKLEKIKTSGMGALFDLTYRAVFPNDKIPKEMVDELRTRNGNLSILIGKFTEENPRTL